MRKVSLFTREGRFYAYVYVQGTPRVVTYDGKTYTCADSVWPTWTFRECDAEEGRPT